MSHEILIDVLTRLIYKTEEEGFGNNKCEVWAHGQYNNELSGAEYGNCMSMANAQIESLCVKIIDA